jgi:hypothetical protein
LLDYHRRGNRGRKKKEAIPSTEVMAPQQRLDSQTQSRNGQQHIEVGGPITSLYYFRGRKVEKESLTGAKTIPRT